MHHPNLFIITLLLVFFSSCSNDIETTLSIPADSSMESLSKKLTISEAKDIAINAYRDFFQNDVTRSQNSQDVSFEDWFCVTSDIDADTLMYVINFADNMGFALISPNRSEEPLAIVEKGHYNPSKTTGIPNFDYYIQQLKQSCIERFYQNNVTLSRAPISSGEGEIVGEITAGPYCEVNWGQTGIYGAYCPNGIAGCNNTTLAQILSIFEVPGALDLTFNDSERLELNWSAIKKHNKGNSCETHSRDVHNSIAKIMRELGYRSGSTYKQNSTSTYNDNSAYQLIQLGFNVQKDEYSDKFILGSIPPNGLGEKGAVIISARDSVEGRHMWMIDGYRNIIKRYTHQLVNPGLGPGLESEPTYETFHYNHYNWGWDGNYNGYFISGNYRCGSLNLNKDQIFYSVSL